MDSTVVGNVKPHFLVVERRAMTVYSHNHSSW